MDTGLSSLNSRKMNDTLKRAQSILGEAYPNDVPISALRILCIVYQNHMRGKNTFLLELEQEIGLTGASISRSVAKMSVWANLRQRGAGYLDKDRDYNDAGRPRTTIRMTEKGIGVMQRILEPME